MRECHSYKWSWPMDNQQMTWKAMNQLEEALFHYFKSVVTFYCAVERRETEFFLKHEVLPLANALKSIIKIQTYLLRMTALYLANMDNAKLLEDYIYRSYMKLNMRMDELWEMTSEHPSVHAEIRPQFKQFKLYFEKKQELMRKYGKWV
jgi:hypothetical protein